MKKYYGALINAVTFFLIYLIFLQGTQPVKYDIQPGGISPEDIYAGREVVNRIATMQLQNEAEQAATNKYVIDNDITQKCQRDLADELIRLSDFKKAYYAAKGDGKKELTAEYTAKFGEELILYIAALDDTAFYEFRNAASKAQTTVLNKGVLNVSDALKSIEEELAGLNEKEKELALSLVKKTIKVNKTLDIAATEAEKARLRSQVPSVIYKENQIIVRKGEVVTDEQFAVLSDLGLVRGSTGVNIAQGMGLIFLLLTAFAAVYLYLKNFLVNYSLKPGNVLFLCVTALVNTAIILLGSYDSINIYAVPVMICGVLVAILADARLGILMGCIFSLFSGIIFKANVYYFISCMFSCTLGVFIYIKATTRKNLTTAAILLCAVNFAVCFFTGLTEGGGFAASLLRGGCGIISGLVTSVFIIGTMPFWENVFSIATPFKLIELSDSKQPLLKRLIMEAPGTYHHSLMVGNLAEAAAEAVGGNPLLARVGSYYHDIGKLQNPIMFKENQMGENAHDKMAPELSASVITAHVRDGVELAKKYKLPEAIRDIIEAHHGNTLVQYFYHKAKQENPDVSETKFRYGRKKPKTVEQAIIMLADSVEAAVRSMDDKSEATIEAQVRKIINSKLSDLQLSDSPLTLCDIEKISIAFIKTMGGYFHSRIKYPTDKGE